MRVCGKTLPPRAALLLTFDFASLVLLMPLLLTVSSLVDSQPRPLSGLLLCLLRLMVAGLACQGVFYYNELYNLQVIRHPGDAFIRTVRAFALLFLLLALFCSAFPMLAPALSHILMLALILAVAAVVTRVAALPRRRERVLLLGTGEEAAELQETVLACPEWNMEVTQILHPSQLGVAWPDSSTPWTCYDRIIAIETQAQPAAALGRLLHWKMQGLRIEDAQGFYERATGRVRVDCLTPEQFVFSYNFDNTARKRRFMRIFDLLATSFLLALTSPVILIVALLIWSRRDGPIVFKQERIGLNGKPFQIYKFRTMRTVMADHPERWAAEEGDRITPLGAFLRKYRIDELLQLLNIARGDMSLVGPRPEQPQFCRLLSSKIPFYDQRHTVLPGLTGWAQVRYHYGASVEESKRKLEYDLFYVKHLSLWLDWAILIETVKVVLVGRGAR